jgi:hypothetical protein
MEGRKLNWMDWIERLFHVSTDAGDGSLKLLYIGLPLAAFCIGSVSVLWFWHYRKRMELTKVSLAPDDLGIANLELGQRRVEPKSEIPIDFDFDLMTRIKLAAEKRGTSTGEWMAQLVVSTMNDPVVLAEIERRHVRRR